MNVLWEALDEALDALRAGDDGRLALGGLGRRWAVPEEVLLSWRRQRILDVDGVGRPVQLRAEELLGVYLPILRILHTHRCAESRRLLAAIGGVPGSGKTTTACVIAELWRELGLSPKLRTLSMDGYHRPNVILDRRTIRQPDGVTIPLGDRKGSPESFDVDAMRADLERLREAGTVVALPRYDRTIHEPVPGAAVVTADDRVVLVEGNYLLDCAGAFGSIGPLFDVRFFLEADASAAREAVIARHQRGGCRPEEAIRKFEMNDALNTQIAERTAGNAHYRITSDATFRKTGLVTCDPPAD